MKQEDQKIRKFGDGSGRVIGALIEVHRALGPGLLESAYEACFSVVDCGYRIDVLVEQCILVELEAVEHLLPLHSAQVLTYMRLLALEVGLLVNFNVTSLRQGLRRFSLRAPSPS